MQRMHPKGALAVVREGFKAGTFIRRPHRMRPVLVKYAFGGSYEVWLDLKGLDLMIDAAARSTRRTHTVGPLRVVFKTLKVEPMEDAP
jgi:hypothetical protein